MNEILNKIQAQIEELEKRIKALSLQFTTSGYMNGFKMCLEEIKELLASYQTQLSTHLADYDLHTDEYNKHLSSYNTLLENYNKHITEYNELLQKQNTTQDNLSAHIQEYNTEKTINSQRLSDVSSGLRGAIERIETLENNSQTVSDERVTNLESCTQTLTNKVSDLETKTTNLENSVSTISGKVTTLETKTSNLENNVSTNAENISSLQLKTSNLENDVPVISDNVKNLQTKTTNIENNISTVSGNVTSLQTKTTNLENDVSTISGKVTTLETNNTSLTNRVSALENGGTGGGGSGGGECNQIETFSFMDNIKKYVCSKARMNYITPKVVFICEPSQTLYIKVRLKGTVLNNNITNDSHEFIMYMNGNVFSQEDVQVQTGNTYEYTFEASYVASEKLNRLLCVLRLYDEYTITEVEVTIIGKNVQIINNSSFINIECFNNQYYITKECKGEAEPCLMYAIQNKDALDLSNSAMQKCYLDDLPEGYYNPTDIYVVPTLAKSSTLTFDTTYENPYKIIGRISYNNETSTEILLKNQDITLKVGADNKLTLETKGTYDIYQMEPMILGFGYGTDVMCETVVAINGTDGRAIVFGKGKNSKLYIKLNGEGLHDEWFSNIPVRKNNAMIGDIHNTCYGFVIWSKKNMYYFYPDLDSTYRVELGPGRNATAYYQPDGTINIYINEYNTIYKYILTKNSENKYEITSKTAIANGTRYFELYDNQAMVMNGFNYQIISN